MSDKIHRIGAGLAAWLILTCAISAGLCEHSRAEKVVLTGTDFSAWLASSDWTIAGNASLHPRNENLLTTEEGTGVIVNGRRANSPPLVSKNTYGDMRAHIEFVIPKGASSGIYFQGQYKLQISDSWGEANSLYPGAECGGIYPRWDDERLVKMYEGRSPKLNASRPPGQWQSFDVIFKAPRFDNEGRKIAHARFLKVLHNGTLIHENVELSGPSWGSLYPQERATGPIALQGDRGPVAFRNIWVVPIDLDKMGLTNPFFAMDTGTIDDVHQSTKSQAEMLKELGYAGIGYWERNPAGGTKGLAEMLGELDKCALKMYPVYFSIKLEEPNERYMPLITASIKLLERREGIIWLAIASDRFPNSLPAGDERAVSIIGDIADFAHRYGVRVALYPRSGVWLDKVDDAVRVAKKVNRRNVGVTFNLYHWLKTDRPANMKAVIKKAIPYLFVVTINGTTEAGSIETLDRGTFDVYGFLRALDQEGFKGPIGLYGIGGDVRENLRRSMAAWRIFSERLAIEKADLVDY